MMTSNCHLMENSGCDILVAQNEKCTKYALIEYFHILVKGCVTVCSPPCACWCPSCAAGELG